jgi:predicted outer membrane protein
MKNQMKPLIASLILLAAFITPACQAQDKTTQSSQAPTTKSGDAKQTNTDAYIALLRRDVRQEKAEIMGAMMVLNAQDSAKFWPIYSEYDEALTKLNELRLENIKEYVSKYNDITDDEADSLIKRAAEYQKQRTELLAQTYEKVRQALGGVTAARFVQVEHQLLLLIDLQVMASLPIVGQGSQIAEQGGQPDAK